MMAKFKIYCMYFPPKFISIAFVLRPLEGHDQAHKKLLESNTQETVIRGATSLRNNFTVITSGSFVIIKKSSLGQHA